MPVYDSMLCMIDQQYLHVLQKHRLHLVSILQNSVIYLFFFLITLFFKQNNNFILSTFIKGIGLLFILTAFSITFPLIWIILALLSVDDDRYKKMYNTEEHSMTESERLLSEVKEHWEEEVCGLRNIINKNIDFSSHASVSSHRYKVEHMTLSF